MGSNNRTHPTDGMGLHPDAKIGEDGVKVRVSGEWSEHEVSAGDMRSGEPYIMKDGDESVIWFRIGTILLSARNGDATITANSISSPGYRGKRFVLLSDMEIEINVKRKTD